MQNNKTNHHAKFPPQHTMCALFIMGDDFALHPASISARRYKGEPEDAQIKLTISITENYFIEVPLSNQEAETLKNEIKHAINED